ncbi:glycerophosphodiester phosphodiesterase [Bifidobacterium sp. ESL0775]|uniref:glycerophosphodiester phosphodiesterase n=1 Tax=Bifidobacterium sp. ESL0775 TaxID=2983230 RepID=UPI0023F866EF|nr:glycerophosphodiester phosphodiesterase [Bifidobacterium sp. ESL0775]WEV69539.1 glycerophosphodiester phosphodiesterase [Bifidobacterium sp. ESL0775]
MADDKTIVVDPALYGETAAEKTAAANKVARKFGIGDDALAKVEDFKKELTSHNAWDLPFMGYVDEDGYGYAYVPDRAIAPPNWDAHAAFKALPYDAQTAFAIRMLFTHRDVDRYGATMFLHYERNFDIKFKED